MEHVPKPRTHLESCLEVRAGARAQMNSSTISNIVSSWKYKHIHTSYLSLDLPVVQKLTDGEVLTTNDTVVLNAQGL